ncbi:hypothetical protein RKD52_002633 [Metabacillus sp. SLBN-84]
MFPFFKKTCYFCKKKVKNSEVYLGEKQKKIHVCRLCKAYAERRAYRKA